MTAAPTTVVFEGTELSIIDREGQPWLSAADLARALGYAQPNQVTRIYSRNQDEFTPGMTERVKLTLSAENNNLQTETRIFSPRGSHLLAMFSRTTKAKAFLRWVLDVLDGLGGGTSNQDQPEAPPPKIDPRSFYDLDYVTDLRQDSSQSRNVSWWAFERTGGPQNWAGSGSYEQGEGFFRQTHHLGHGQRTRRRAGANLVIDAAVWWECGRYWLLRLRTGLL